MNTIDYHKEQINNIQYETVQKTRDIIKLINESQDKGSETIRMLDEQYEKLQRCNNLIELVCYFLRIILIIL